VPDRHDRIADVERRIADHEERLYAIRSELARLSAYGHTDIMLETEARTLEERLKTMRDYRALLLGRNNGS